MFSAGITICGDVRSINGEDRGVSAREEHQTYLLSTVGALLRTSKEGWERACWRVTWCPLPSRP